MMSSIVLLLCFLLLGVVLAGEECIDTPEWVGVYGKEKVTCENYIKDTDCEEFYAESDDGTRNDQACCVCGGGSNGEECLDKEKWEGINEGGGWMECLSYGTYEDCEKSAIDEKDGVDNYAACCVCGGNYYGEENSEECTDTADWFGTDDWGGLVECGFYLTQTDCDKAPATSEDTGTRHDQACCVCGGGVSATCTDWADWKTTTGGYTCESAFKNDAECQKTGYVSEDGYTAKDACCMCGGGDGDGESASTGQCSDYEGWSTWSKEGSQEYYCADYDVDRCEKSYGEYSSEGGVAAFEACCVCGGGVQEGECQPSHVEHSDFSEPGSIRGVAGDTFKITCFEGFTGGGVITCEAPYWTEAVCEPLEEVDPVETVIEETKEPIEETEEPIEETEEPIEETKEPIEENEEPIEETVQTIQPIEETEEQTTQETEEPTEANEEPNTTEEEETDTAEDEETLMAGSSTQSNGGNNQEEEEASESEFSSANEDEGSSSLIMEFDQANQLSGSFAALVAGAIVRLGFVY